MDPMVIEAIKQAGIDVTFEKHIPTVAILVDRDGRLLPMGDEVRVMAGEKVAMVRPRKISELWTGRAPALGDTPTRVPDFSGGPPPEYVFFFAMIEMTAADFCSCTRTRERDEEFRRLYHQLRRRPDGTDPNPIFAYLQAAARVYMSLRDVSRPEFEAVVSRLASSAKLWSESYSSTNYQDRVLAELLNPGHGGDTHLGAA